MEDNFDNELNKINESLSKYDRDVLERTLRYIENDWTKYYHLSSKQMCYKKVLKHILNIMLKEYDYSECIYLFKEANIDFFKNKFYVKALSTHVDVFTEIYLYLYDNNPYKLKTDYYYKKYNDKNIEEIRERIYSIFSNIAIK